MAKFFGGFGPTKRQQKRSPELIAADREALELRRGQRERAEAAATGQLPRPRPYLDVEKLRERLAAQGELLTAYDKETGSYQCVDVGLDSYDDLLPYNPPRPIRPAAPYDVDIREWHRLDGRGRQRGHSIWADESPFDKGDRWGWPAIRRMSPIGPGLACLKTV